MKKVPITELNKRVKIYSLFEECIEIGARGGYNRAHKHTSTPDEETFIQEIVNYVMLAFEEKFCFRESDI